MSYRHRFSQPQYLGGLLAVAAGFSLSAAQKPWIESTTLFLQGQAGIHTYRIPALLETRSGALIAVADARRDSSNDLPGHIALVIRRSFDRGRTWTPSKILVQPSEGGAGDASLLLDRRTGRIWCFFAYGPPGIGFRTSQAGAQTGPSTLQIHAIHSDDDGQHWSAPQDLTPQIKDRSWHAAFVTSGRHIQLADGRFLLPLVVRDQTGSVSARNAYSDDGGLTWHVGKSIGAGTDESKAIELKDHTILQSIRDGRMMRLVGTSEDGGITIMNLRHDPNLIDPRCNAGLALDPRSERSILVFTNPASRVRKTLTVRLSFDNGRSWPQSRILFPGPAAYSSVTFLRDGTIAVLYEAGKVTPTEQIIFARFNLAWVHARKQRSLMADGERHKPCRIFRPLFVLLRYGTDPSDHFDNPADRRCAGMAIFAGLGLLSFRWTRPRADHHHCPAALPRDLSARFGLSLENRLR